VWLRIAGKADGKRPPLSWWDKEAKKEVPVDYTHFPFVVLDQTNTVRGYSERHKASVFSNEVRDTRTDVLVVKIRGGGVVATGVWNAIKEAVTSKAVGGAFGVNLYIGYECDTKTKELAIGVLELKGASVGQWFEFSKSHRSEIYSTNVVAVNGDRRTLVCAASDSDKRWRQENPDGLPVDQWVEARNAAGAKLEVVAYGVKITRFTPQKHGSNEYVVPEFGLVRLQPRTAVAAIELDVKLQSYLAEYFSRARSQAAEPPAGTGEGAQPDSTDTGAQPDANYGAGQEPAGEPQAETAQPGAEDDVPF
jgi:hypothetical protein